MSRRPQRLSASSTIALRSRSLVTSASNATALPPVFSLSASIRPAVSFAEARLRSTHNTDAPSRAKVIAVARPLPMPSPGLWPAPTTIAILSFSRMSFHSGDNLVVAGSLAEARRWSYLGLSALACIGEVAAVHLGGERLRAFRRLSPLQFELGGRADLRLDDMG